MTKPKKKSKAKWPAEPPAVKARLFTLATVLSFGKYKNHKIEDLLENSDGTSYVRWMVDNLHNDKVDKELLEELNEAEETFDRSIDLVDEYDGWGTD